MPDPGVAPPIDASMQQAVSNAIVQSGASGLGPSAAPTPLSVFSQGGDDPSVTFQFTRGSDGKLYGKGDPPPPPGPHSNVTIRIRDFHGTWLVSTEVTHLVSFTSGGKVRTGRRTDAIGMSGARANYELTGDQGIGWNVTGVRSSEIRNAERFRNFLPTDLLTGVRQSLWSLQAKGQLYQFEVTPSAPDLTARNVMIAAAALVATGVLVFVAGRGSGGGTSTPTAPAVTGYECSGNSFALFDNSNGAGVSDGGVPPTFTTKGETYCLDQIQTYHWNSGKGVPPGMLSITGGSTTIGPFQAKASSGQNNAPNVNWYYYPGSVPPVLINGSYSCKDSDPSTWSSNPQSGGAGFCQIWVKTAVKK